MPVRGSYGEMRPDEELLAIMLKVQYDELVLDRGTIGCPPWSPRITQEPITQEPMLEFL